MSTEELRRCIETGDIDGVRAALARDAALANSTIRWHLNQDNESDPLHYVSDCVARDLIDDAAAAQMAGLLLAAGAAIDGSPGRESPLIAAASLGAEKVAALLVEAGADLERTSIFGSRALHWAAWVGLPATVAELIGAGARIEARCTEFGATPLFWAVHGYGPNGPRRKTGQVDAARVLIAAGASIATTNKRGLAAIDLAREAASGDMHELMSAARSGGGV